MNSSTSSLTESIFYILLTLQEPMHGYGIMQRTSAMSKGRLILSAGTLYGALSNLLEKGWISPCGESSECEGRRKLYKITEAGEAVLVAELKRLEELVLNGNQFIKK